MRTLTLLVALFLLALQAQAQSLEERADQLPTQDQPGAEVRDMTISFDGDERSTREASKSLTGTVTCTCRCSRDCSSNERLSGVCRDKKNLYWLCCRH